uniref:NADH-ubiquinone oxidoreductase chain 4 n=1 Tax=Chrysotus sp. TaxID=2908774 RepID=A0A977XVH4_9MUSC|nr:NADH dehydrogenase subunit 4 [Chrysotus sp.]
MLKILFMLSMLSVLSLMKNMFWMVQNMMFLLSFIFILMNYFGNYFMSISYFLGCDLLSYGMVLLSMWICCLMLLASESVEKYNNYKNLFLLNVVMLLLLLLLSFSTMNLFLFYLFFEGSLIPTMFLVLGWGYQPERLQAGMYLLFYTLLASLPMMIGIFYIYNDINNLNFYFLVNNMYDYDMLYLVMIFAFLVKMPMFLVHDYLKHMSSSSFWFYNFGWNYIKISGLWFITSFFFFKKFSFKMNFIWVSISLVGGFFVSLICLRQTDLKSLIAYSSVAHMGIVLSGLMTMTYWGFCGSYTLMIAHGLCSSGLFCLANISYERLNSRSLLINKGLLNFMPSMAFWWFLLSSANMAAPPTLNLLGEISLLNSVISWSWLTMIMIALLSFFSAAYTLYLYSYSQHGKIYSGVYAVSSGLIREYLLLFLHWFPLNLLILKSDSCMLWL